MSDQGRKEVLIGGFVLAGLVLVGMMFWILENQAFQKKYRVSAEFTYAGGIREGTPVHMAGKPIGQVQNVTFREDKDKGEVKVDVVLEIEEQYTIRKDSKLTVGSVGLLGEKIIEFTLGTAAAGELAKDGTARVAGQVPPGLEDLQNTLEAAVGDLRGTIVKVNTLLDHLNDAELQAGLKGAITGVDDLAKKAGGIVTKLDGTLEKVDGFVTKADSFVGKADEFAGKANTAVDSVNKILTTADEVVAKLNDLATKISSLSEDAQKQVNSVGDSVNKLAASLQENSTKLNEILASLDTVAKDAASGKGTVGHLLKDDTTARKLDELLASLKVTSDSLSKTSDYLRAHPNSIIFGRSEDGKPAPVDWRDRK